MTIPLFKVFMADEAGEQVLDTLYSGYITEGPRVQELEYVLKRWLDVRYLNTTNSGTSALVLALKAAGVRSGTKVISTAMTCSATNMAIRVCDGDIVWADVNPRTGNIDPNRVEDILKTSVGIKAIMAVHWGGYPCDLSNLNYLAKKYDVYLIEDAAHALGAVYNKQRIGVHSDFVCFSTQAIKHLTTVDGGFVVSREEHHHNLIKKMRWFGIDREAPRQDLRCELDIELVGSKYHMNDVNAVIGLANMKHIEKIIDKHQKNGLYYDLVLDNIPGLSLIERKSDRLSAYWLYTILVKNRDLFINKMSEKGIMTSKVHSRNDTHSVFSAYKKDLPGVDAFMKEQVSIPVGWWITEPDRDYIVKAIKDTMKEIL